MSDPHADHARARIREARDTFALLEDSAGIIAAIAGRMIAALEAGGKVLFCGNGGSASDSLHLALELSGRFYRNRRPLPALALSASGPELTALGNDFGFEEVFARQVTGLGRPGDVLIGLSTSGSSKNVLRAMEAAREAGLFRVGLTGAGGDALESVVDLCLKVPATDTPRIQEAHLLAGHIACELTEAALAGANPSG